MTETSFQRGTNLYRRFNLVDIIIAAVVVIVVIIFGATLYRQLSLRHEVSAAKAVSNQFITDLQHQNATHAHALGDATFQSNLSVKQLGLLFTNAKPYATGAAAIDDQTVTNRKTSDDVRFIYKFNPSKPYYIRVIVSKTSGSSAWKIINIAGGSTESTLKAPVLKAN